ncbi:hypothetical protein [Vibrio sp. ZF 223]|uniref:hypothetical protein n=1 Tax=Vibrio sp. ZF 223 TaxID=2056191 RepID=UPI000D335153|nr:hypothetical protein [Vibrio sp. ZF 223]PTQ02299.1 hypothetical protein CWO13_16200 [Vibrio sp. ZF 223]
MERHIVLFWPSAVENYPDIISDFGKRTDVISSLDLECKSKPDMMSLLNCLYGEKLKGRDYKYKEVGLGTIKAYIVEVNSEYKVLQVTSGLNSVNLYMHELKKSLRLKCGGGHNVHGTEDIIEATDDAILFFQKEIDKIEVGTKYIESFSDWKSKGESWFDEYLRFKSTYGETSILRGIGIDEQGTDSDIDILVDDKLVTSLRKRLRLSAKKPKKLDSRAFYSLSSNIDFDLRLLSDNYLPLDLSKALFESEESLNEYNEMQIKGIAYHCLVHKNFVNTKYLNCLELDANTSSVYKIDLLGIIERDINLCTSAYPCKDISVGYYNYTEINGNPPTFFRRFFWGYLNLRKFISFLIRPKRYEAQIEII